MLSVTMGVCVSKMIKNFSDVIDGRPIYLTRNFVYVPTNPCLLELMLLASPLSKRAET